MGKSFKIEKVCTLRLLCEYYGILIEEGSKDFNIFPVL